jgi:molybdenum cofactor cytidylyltransferase
MRLELVPIDAAIGHILCHNIADPQGRKALGKGRVLQPADGRQLAELGHTQVRVAILDAGDVHENAAALRLAAAVAGRGIQVGSVHAGRVNLTATTSGPLQVEVAALHAINELDGLTVATLPAYTLVRPGAALATIKVIPFAVPAPLLAEAEAIGDEVPGILRVPELVLRAVGVVLVSSPAACGRVERGVFPAIAGRIADLGGRVIGPEWAPPAEAAVAAAIQRLRAAAAEMIIVAGETSVMDMDDVTPAGVRLAGGRIEHFGAPVEPGNLLLLAYLPNDTGAELPVIGAPGCVRSRDVNIVDLLLPRILAGEQVRRRDIVALGHGGFLGR